MCGIFATLKISACNCNLGQTRENLLEFLKRRGPDQLGEHIEEIGNDAEVTFMGTLLWLRGLKPQVQPYVSDQGILLWNGDLFNHKIPHGMSDTELIASKLSKAASVSDILRTLSDLEGPGAYVYYSRKFNTLWFGRDVLGRHSLLIDAKSCHLVLSSIGHADSPLVEVPASGIFSVSPANLGDICLTPWKTAQEVIGLPFNFVKDHHRSLDSKIARISLAMGEHSGTDLAGFLNCPHGQSHVSGLHEVLIRSVVERIEAQPNLCKDCVRAYLVSGEPSSMKCTHVRVAILFSGGLDSAVLAALTVAHYSEPIDLVNVAFEQENGSFDVPDRRTAHIALEEIRRISKFDVNLVLVDVTKAELRELRKSRIRHLLHPLDTVLDDSIGCAIWFAARGRGTVNGAPYQSPARVLLLGMGADEQLGGYSKHKAAFVNGGRESLIKEVQRQVDAISERNLGRDNRIVSDHGVAGRYPFLDERLVNFLAELPLEAKMNLSLERGTGDKLVLRALAHFLGLEKTACEPKRAIQFGSRIAKMENRKEKATDKAIRS